MYMANCYRALVSPSGTMSPFCPHGPDRRNDAHPTRPRPVPAPRGSNQVDDDAHGIDSPAFAAKDQRTTRLSPRLTKYPDGGPANGREPRRNHGCDRSHVLPQPGRRCRGCARAAGLCCCFRPGGPGEGCARGGGLRPGTPRRTAAWSAGPSCRRRATSCTTSGGAHARARCATTGMAATTPAITGSRSSDATCSSPAFARRTPMSSTPSPTLAGRW